MNRKISMAGIIIWSLVAILILGVLITALTGRFSIPFANFRAAASSAELIKEEAFPAGGLMKFKIDTRSEDIRVKFTDGDTVNIRLYGDIANDPPFTSGKSNVSGRTAGGDGYQLSVSIPSRVRFMNIQLFNWFTENYLDIELPASYAEDIDFSTSSGDIAYPDGFSCKKLSLSTSSGDITVGEGAADDLTLRTKSGNIKPGEVKVAGDLKIDTSSGDVRASELTANNAYINTMSGSINFTQLRAENRAELSVSSGDVRAGTLDCREYDIRALSGGVRFNRALSGRGKIHTSSGDINVSEMALTGDVSVNAQSGGVRLSLASGQQCDLALRTNSGTIRCGAPLSYGDRNGKEATGKVGDGGPLLSVGTSSGSLTIDTK